MSFVKLLLCFSLLTIVACSSKSDTYSKLEEIDVLLHNGNDTLADKQLNLIDRESIKNQEDRAYYDLLKSEILYWNNDFDKSDSIINICIEYYRRKGNNEKLAQSYYIRSLLSFNSLGETALLDLKNAETLSEKTSDLRLRKRIYTALTLFFGNSDEFETALLYAKKEYACAQMIGDDRLIAYSLIDLSISYDRTNQDDSAAWCIRECEKLANQLEPHYQAFLYFGLGNACFKTDKEKSKYYLNKSLEIDHLTQSYKLLSDIYLEENNIDAAQKLWDSVLNTNFYELKIDILNMKAEYYYQCRDIDVYKSVQDSKSEATKIFYENRLQNKAKELSQKYDADLLRHRHKTRTIFMMAMSASVFIVMFLLVYIRIRRLEAEKMSFELEHIKSRERLKNMEEKLAVLETDKKSKTMEVFSLKEKINLQKLKIQKDLQQGQILFNKLANGESPINWNNKDLLCLLDYVAINYKDFYNDLETEYGNISNNQKIFIIADNLFKKNDFELCCMFGLEKKSLYVRRRRIAQKQAVTAEL